MMAESRLNKIASDMKKATTPVGKTVVNMARHVKGGTTTRILLSLMRNMANVPKSITDDNRELRAVTKINAETTQISSGIKRITNPITLATQINNGISELKNGMRTEKLGEAYEQKWAPYKPDVTQCDNNLTSLMNNERQIIIGQHRQITEVFKALESGASPESVRKTIDDMDKQKRELSLLAVKQAANNQALDTKLRAMLHEISGTPTVSTTSAQPVRRPGESS